GGSASYRGAGSFGGIRSGGKTRKKVAGDQYCDGSVCDVLFIHGFLFQSCKRFSRLFCRFKFLDKEALDHLLAFRAAELRAFVSSTMNGLDRHLDSSVNQSLG